MSKARICAPITKNDFKSILEIQPQIDLFELRFDLLGADWIEIVPHLQKPWIACNRKQDEGGKAAGNESERIEELIKGIQWGASIVDIEYTTKNIKEVISRVKGQAKCLISYHDYSGTPTFNTLVQTLEGQIAAGADICKIVTTARDFQDNLTILKLIPMFPKTRLIAFAMGEAGRISRILSPLMGGYCTYACIGQGQESAEGQMTVGELAEIYKGLKNE